MHHCKSIILNLPVQIRKPIPDTHCLNIFRQKSQILLIIFAILMIASSGYGQNDAQLFGKVFDKNSENPVENTIVYLNPDYQYAETNTNGEYLIPHLKPGTYQVFTKHVGYNSDQTKHIDIKPGEKIKVDFYLTEIHYSTTDAIVVTATRANSTTLDLPHSMSVISPERISTINPLNISEALLNIQGAFIKDYGSVGDLKTVSLRGSNPEQVLILLDGQRLNNPQTGQVDLSTISLDEIERIEILRGGSSAVYGADAVGGVLNMITRKERKTKGIGLTLRGFAGSFNTRSLDTALDFNNNMVDGSVTYKHLKSDGDFSYSDPDGNKQIRRNNDLNSQNVFAAMKIKLNPSPLNMDLDMSYRYYTSERGSPGPLDFPSLTARQWDTSQQLQTQLRGKVFNPLHSYTLQGFFNRSQTRFEEPEGIFATDSKSKSGNYGVESNVRSVILPNHILTYGLGYRKEWMSSNQFPENHDRNIYFFFLQDEIEFKSEINESPLSFEIIPALRYDNYSDFGSRWSPKIGAGFSIGSTWQTILKANAGLNFRAPTFNELYWPADTWSSGNPDLLPETGTDWDLGLHFRFPDLNRLSLDLTYFDTRMDDLIQWQSIAMVYMPINISKSRTRGLEVNSSLQLIDNMLEVIGNYTYLDAKNKSEGEYKNRFLVYRSRHNFNLSLNWRWKSISVAYDYRSLSKQYSDEINSSENEMKPFDISDLSFRFKHKIEKWQPVIILQVRNIFNKNYQIIRSYPLPGREYRVTLEVAYH